MAIAFSANATGMDATAVTASTLEMLQMRRMLYRMQDIMPYLGFLLDSRFFFMAVSARFLVLLFSVWHPENRTAERFAGSEAQKEI